MKHLKLRTLVDGEFVPVYLDEDGFYRMDHKGNHIPVRKKDVDQFIWVLDENGNEVWENDIIDNIWMEERDKEGAVSRGLIKYNSIKHSFMIFGMEKWPCHIDQDLKIGGFLRHKIRVIGNSKKNPELMEGLKKNIW